MITPGTLGRQVSKARRLATLLALFSGTGFAIEPLPGADYGRCTGVTLLDIPLAPLKSEFLRRSPSGHMVSVGPGEGGWVVGAYAPSDDGQTDNLLSPAGESNGLPASWIGPEIAPVRFGPRRLLGVRGTPHSFVCARLVGAKFVSEPRLRFTSGRLIVTWMEHP